MAEEPQAPPATSDSATDVTLERQQRAWEIYKSLAKKTLDIATAEQAEKLAYLALLEKDAMERVRDIMAGRGLYFSGLTQRELAKVASEFAMRKRDILRSTFGRVMDVYSNLLQGAISMGDVAGDDALTTLQKDVEESMRILTG